VGPTYTHICAPEEVQRAVGNERMDIRTEKEDGRRERKE
jgi:hypothetical protein